MTSVPSQRSVPILQTGLKRSTPVRVASPRTPIAAEARATAAEERAIAAEARATAADASRLRYEAMLNEVVTASLSRATAAEARAAAAEASTAAALTTAEDLSRQTVVGAPLELGPRRPESE